VQNIPLDVLPSMSGPGLAQYTAEIRYRVNTPLPASGADGFDVMWFNVGGGWLSGDSGPDIRMTEGVYLTPGSKEESFYAQWSAEGFKGSNPNIYYAPASDFAGTTRGEWHTLRLIQDEVNDVQEVYIDSTLISTVDISSYDRSFTFTRGLAFGAYGIDVPPGEQLPEVLYDYIRVADGVVPIGVAINAPGGAVFDEADFNQDGAVNAADLAAWSANFGRSAGATKAQGDSNADGRVNGIDFLKWQQQFGRSGGAFAAVPEPSTALTATLLASALLARRKRAAL
jgi:hypothetical protein